MVMRGLRCVLAARTVLVMVTRWSLTIIINIQTTTKCDANAINDSRAGQQDARPSFKDAAISSLAIFNLFSSPLYTPQCFSLLLFLYVFSSSLYYVLLLIRRKAFNIVQI